MKRCPSEELLLRLAEDELDKPQAKLLSEHTRTCRECRDLLEEYKKALSLLTSAKLGEASSADWERVMARVRERLQHKDRRWPLWVKAVAVTAAAACVIVVLWHAGIETGRKPGGTPDIARRSGQGISTGEKDTADAIVAEVKETTVADEKSLAEETRIHKEEDLFEAIDAVVSREAEDASDTTSLGLASLDDDELSELDELAMVAGVLQSSDFLVFDLTEEEEAEFVKELKSLSSM